MLMCSESIAHLAGALAKAQVELTNPVKSCTAVLERGRDNRGSGERAGSEGAGQSYRYAPLSAGLDIVRRSLGQQAIAVIQATEVDRESGTVLLTTTLAHGSGEWIAAKWPVCRVSDMAQPKLMGAALTYARRYSLFSLVGLAGEDDLDAVELSPGQREADERQVVDLAAVAGGHPLPPSRRDPRAGTLRRSPARGRIGSMGPTRGEEACLSDPEGSLEQARDEAGLLRWAVAALPYRNTLTDQARAELDTAFLARAQAIRADPDLLAAFTTFGDSEREGPAGAPSISTGREP
ncbi:MAG TPA: ERF family protein [Microvirga sp.]|nr:ERF family protein [Microvirga sp.]